MKKNAALRRPLGHRGRVQSHNTGLRQKKHVDCTGATSATEVNTTKNGRSSFVHKFLVEVKIFLKLRHKAILKSSAEYSAWYSLVSPQIAARLSCSRNTFVRTGRAAKAAQSTPKTATGVQPRIAPTTATKSRKIMPIRALEVPVEPSARALGLMSRELSRRPHEPTCSWNRARRADSLGNQHMT